MALWQDWRALARDSETAARNAEAEGHLRSSVSRYYYAAYQAVSAVLLFRGITPPTGREAWSHAVTPQMIKDHLQRFLPSTTDTEKSANDLSTLYKLRVSADYVTSDQIGSQEIADARQYAEAVIQIAVDNLPGG